MIKVVDTNCLEWNNYVDKLPLELRDVYYTREYYRVQEANGDGIGKLFIYEVQGNIALYPFLINEVKRDDLDNIYYDIESAYGYGGPIANINEKKFLEDFEEVFVKYCKENNIIAEFIRFNPLLNNEDIFNQNIEVLENRTVVYLDLNSTIDDIWKNHISSKNRNMIRKAEKLGLKVEISNNVNEFREIYESTMDKVNASSYYFFKDEYYKELKQLDNTYISIRYEEQIIASAIFMKYGEKVHYHLAGSLKEYLSYAPNNLLLWAAIQYAHKEGYKTMLLGGGLTHNLTDSLFKFKKSFSKRTHKFYIGKRVHNKKVYEELIKSWEVVNQKEATLFLQYRL